MTSRIEWSLGRRAARVVGLVVVSMLMGGLAAAPAMANSIGIEKNRARGVCLDSNFAGQVYTNPCWNGDLYQQWDIYGSLGGALLINGETGRCLDYNHHQGLFTGTSCSLNDQYDTWVTYWHIGGGTTWINFAYGVCIDYNTREKLFMNTCNYGSYQTWTGANLVQP